MAEKTIGLIGMGLLGSALADRLIASGYNVWGYDTSSAATHAFSEAGGRPVARISDVPVAADQVILCLPDSNVVSEVMIRIIPHLRPGSTVIDTTTGDPDRTCALAEQLESAQIELLDASVLGSSEVTRKGQAVLLVGGQLETFEKCQPMLAAIADQVIHVGQTGAGQKMKLVANLVLGLNRAVLAEGLHFAGMFDLDPGVVLEVLQAGAAYSRAMDAKGLKMIQRDFAPQARLSQHLKDVNLILDYAERADTQLPLSEIHRMLLKKVADTGGGDLDNSAIVQAWR